MVLLNVYLSTPTSANGTKLSLDSRNLDSYLSLYQIIERMFQQKQDDPDDSQNNLINPEIEQEFQPSGAQNYKYSGLVKETLLNFF